MRTTPFFLAVLCCLYPALAVANSSKVKGKYQAGEQLRSTVAEACRDYLERRNELFRSHAKPTKPPAETSEGAYTCYWQEDDGSPDSREVVSLICPDHSDRKGSDCVCDDGYVAQGDKCEPKREEQKPEPKAAQGDQEAPDKADSGCGGGQGTSGKQTNPGAIAISSLPRVTLDFTAKGPGLQSGLEQAERLITEKRSGFLCMNVQVRSAVIPVIMSRENLYILGFRSSNGWWRFSKALWPLSPKAESLGYDGRYLDLGGLDDGKVTLDTISDIAKLAKHDARQDWPGALRTLLVVVAENLRLVPVRSRVILLLNQPGRSFKLNEVKEPITNWEVASRSKDASVIIRR